MFYSELNEQTLASSKKEAETTGVNGNGRDRRYVSYFCNTVRLF